MARRSRLLKVAHLYYKAGFTPLPLQGGEDAKIPLTCRKSVPCGFMDGELVMLYEAGWGESPFSWERFDEMFTLAAGIGIAVGTCSGGLAVLDFDDAEAHRIWLKSHRRIAQRMPAVKTVRGVHYYFWPPSRPSGSYFKFRVDGCHEMAGELKLSNSYVVAPPSRHPNGVKYKWIGTETLERLPHIAIEELGIERACGRELTESEAIDLIDLSDQRELPKERMIGNLTRSGGASEATHLNDSWDVATRLLRRCIPRQAGQRHDGLMALVQALKSVPDLRDQPAEHYVRLVKVWCEKLVPLPFVEAKDFRRNWREFRSLWNGCEMSSAERFQQLVAARSLRDLASRDKVRVICGCLSQKNCGQAFYLGSKSLARCIGVTPTQARRILERLTSDREIIRVSTGRHGNLTASRYRLGPKFVNGHERRPDLSA